MCENSLRVSHSDMKDLPKELRCVLLSPSKFQDPNLERCPGVENHEGEKNILGHLKLWGVLKYAR